MFFILLIPVSQRRSENILSFSLRLAVLLGVCFPLNQQKNSASLISFITLDCSFIQSVTMRAIPALLLAMASCAWAGFWMENIRHQGLAPFNPDKSYVVFRNVKDFGAKGDGGK